MVGSKNIEQMRANLETLNNHSLSEHKLKRVLKIGDYLYKK